MNAAHLDLEAELASMAPADAQRFRQAVRAMLSVWKSRSKGTQQNLGHRISSHPAIGTWPKDSDVDQHIAKLRSEWE
jgi:hypothetical protein